jgi:hypothetical protein
MQWLHRLARAWTQVADRSQQLVAPLNDEQARSAYWFTALLATLPALRANRLLPHDWLERLLHDLPPPPLENPAGALMLLPLGLSLLLARRLQGQRYLLAAWPYLLLMLGTLPAVPAAEAFATLYSLFAVGVIIAFAVSGSALSSAFGAYIVALMLWRVFDPVLSTWAIVFFVLSVLVARLVVEAWRQNRPLYRALGREDRWQLAKRTLQLWWPMSLLLLAGLWLNAELGRRAENALYASGIATAFCDIVDAGPDSVPFVCPAGHDTLRKAQLAPLPETAPPRCVYRETPPGSAPEHNRADFACPPDYQEGTSWEVVRRPLFENVDLGIARFYQNRRDALARDLERLRATIDAGGDVGVNAAQDLFDGAVPQSTGIERRHCDFPYVACEAGNLVIGELNDAYAEARDEAEIALDREIGELDATSKTYTRDSLQAAESTIGPLLHDYELRTRAAVFRVHLASTMLQQLLLLWLVVAFVKSLLYVFSRVAFDQGTSLEVDLMEMEGDPVEGSVALVDEVDIPADYPHAIYYKANYQPLGPAPRFSIPQWPASLLARLRHGAWNMSLVNFPLRHGNRLTFNAIEAEHLVDWELREGEEVVFNYANFVAMNEHVRLRTVVSLRVATLLLGRMVFHTARCEGGPGRLILRTRGKPATARQVEQSIPISRLVAWNRYARFSVDSHLTPADIFLNGFNLRRSPGDADGKPQGLLIVEADARDGGILVGTLRFARNFLLPI